MRKVVWGRATHWGRRGGLITSQDFEFLLKMAETEKDIALKEIAFELSHIRAELEKINRSMEKLVCK